MTSVGSNTRNKERGTRREPKIHHGHRITSQGPFGNGLVGSNLGVHSGQLGEHRLNMPQVHAIDNLFNTHPAVQAARSVLHGQLLSGGLQVMRGGKRVDLQPTFHAHLTKYWLPFARDIIDHLLKFGMVPFCFELEPEDLIYKAVKRVKRESDATKDTKGGAAAKLAKPKAPRNQIPVVPMLGTYDIGWAAGGRAGYTRTYYVYSQAPGMTTKPDEECFVHVRQHPDGVGNINSPIASVFELGSFVTALTDLAYTAEVSRSLPAVTTQVRKPDKTNSLDTGALFFDSESRAVAGGQQAEESENAATQLQMQAALMKIINQLQTHREGQDPLSRRQDSGRAAIAPPDIPPRLFVLPKDQEVAPGLQQPEARGDLQSLIQMSIDQFCAAVGVPAGLVFDSKFAGKSTQQLSLLNSTVAQLAAATSEVLTKCYRALYGEDSTEEENGLLDGANDGASSSSDVLSDPPVLSLRTSPLAASEEVVALYQAQLLPCSVAVASSMHALGVNSEAIDEAVEEMCKRQKKADQQQDDEIAQGKEDRKLQAEVAKVNMEKTKADVEVTKKEARGMIKPTAASSGGGSSGGGS